LIWLSEYGLPTKFGIQPSCFLSGAGLSVGLLIYFLGEGPPFGGQFS
jgi:hypothetical protein